jgi:hypothetical protein
MKANLKGLGGIKGLFLAHGEKLGMAIVVTLALFLVYKGLQQQPVDARHQPEKLDELIRMAKNDVESSSWDKASPEEVRHVSPIEKAADKPIDRGAYQSPTWQIGPDPPVVPPVVLRTDPVLLAALKLEANGGSGLLAFTNDEIRQQRALEAQAEADRKAMAQQKEQEKQQKDADKGKSQRTGANSQERTGRGGEIVDPEHPNRRSTAGVARAAGIPIEGDEEIRPAYWANVVAKVPIKDQFKLYQDAFQNARGYFPEADIPKYLGFRVQRAEVLPGEEGKATDWKDVPVYNGKGKLIGSAVSLLTLYGRAADEGKKAIPGVADDWAAKPEEIVDPRYLDADGVLAFPLPPLVGRDWGAEATHSEIPLASKATDAEPDAPQPEDKNAIPDAPTDEFAAGDPSVASGPRRRAPVSVGRGGGGREMEGGYGGRGGMSRGESAPAMRGGRGGRGGESAPAGRGNSNDPTPQVAYWLLRFFDFSVEPGKKYKYHVQLVFQDPNQNSDMSTRLVSSDSLDKKVLDRLKDDKLKAEKAGKKPKPIRLTEWSDPSPTVSIPLAGNVRVASAKPASDRANDEPVTTLLVESFGTDDKGKATQAAKEEDFRRGSVANMTKDVEFLGPDGRYIDLQKNFPFHTGITILDIDGGNPLAKDVKEPARVLLMDQAGQLFVQSEVADADAVQLHRDIFAEPDKQRGGRLGGRGEAGGREGPRAPGGFQQGPGGRER